MSKNDDRHLLLGELVWKFDGDHYSDIVDFEKALVDRQIDIHGHDDDWHPKQIMFRNTRIRILFTVCVDGRDIQPELEMQSEGPNGFSALEFMFKLHNGLVPILRNDPHNYFEGLAFDQAWQEPGKPPLYLVLQGS